MMSRNALLSVATAFALLGVSAAIAAPSVIAHYAGPDGPWDYVSIDSVFDRIYVGRSDGVLAVDMKTGVVTPRFVQGRYTAAVIPLKDGKFALSTSRHDDLISFFDRKTGKVIAEIPTDKGPDAATLDPVTGIVYVMNGDAGTISVVDGARRKIIAKIAVGGGLEAAALDGKGHLFVNVEDTAEIAVVDLKASRTTGHIKLPGCEEPSGIVIDTKTYLGYSVCANGQLNVVDTKTRKVVTSVVVGKDCDGLMIDEARKRVYASSNDGTLSIVSIIDGRKPRLLTDLRTKPNARTGALDPATGRVYVAGGPYKDDVDQTPHFEVLALDATQ